MSGYSRRLSISVLSAADQSFALGTASIHGLDQKREKMKQFHEASTAGSDHPYARTAAEIRPDEGRSQERHGGKKDKGESEATTPTTVVSSIRTAERVPSRDAPSTGRPLSNGIGSGRARIRSGGFRHSIRYAENERAPGVPEFAPRSTSAVQHYTHCVFGSGSVSGRLIDRSPSSTRWGAP